MISLDIDIPKRRSRMRRTSTGKRLELTARDLEIFKLLSRYRHLRSTYIHDFVGGNKTKLIERLGHLYHEGGYLDRPQQQWEAVNARYMPAAYELGVAGKRVLEENGIWCNPSGRERPPRRFRHELMVCESVATIELETRASADRRFISWQEILTSPKMPEATANSPNPMAIAAPTSYVCPKTKSRIQIDRALIPDALFGIEYLRCERKSYRFFALEADMSSEPVVRTDPRQSSYLRKIAQYRDILNQGSYRGQWGIPNLLVLTMTSNARHLESMLRVVSELTEGKGTPNLLFAVVPCGTNAVGPRSAAKGLLDTPWLRAGYDPLVIGQA